MLVEGRGKRLDGSMERRTSYSLPNPYVGEGKTKKKNSLVQAKEL
jgi:hypothetical protein